MKLKKKNRGRAGVMKLEISDPTSYGIEGINNTFPADNKTLKHASIKRGRNKCNRYHLASQLKPINYLIS